VLQLHTSKFTFPLVGYPVIVNPPLVAGIHPTTALIEALGVNEIVSVVATPVALIVNVAQLVEEIDPRLFRLPAPDAVVVPFAIVVVS